MDSKEVTSTPSAACTSACTSDAENANADPSTPGDDQADAAGRNQGDQDKAAVGDRADQGGAAGGSSTADQGDPLAKLADALLTLTPADRARLAAMLDRDP
jgi:hypothetical protein